MLEPRTTAFTNAVRAGDVAKARKLFPTAREPYERIEPVAESFGDSIPEIDARAGDVPAATWTGFHRLEKMLWVDNATAAADEAVRRQARHGRRQARGAREDGRLPDRADRERGQEPDGRDRRLEGDGRGGPLLPHRSLRLQGERRRRQGRLRRACEPILQKRAPSLAVTIDDGFADMDPPWRRSAPGRVGSSTRRSTPPSARTSRARSTRSRLPLSNMAAIVAQ